MRKHITTVLEEIRTVLSKVQEKQILQLIEEIRKANTIVVCGAGRVGMMTRSFGMRLGHLGLRAYTLGDSTVPGLKEGDLFLVSSGSGETETIYQLVVIAKKHGARVALITGNPGSRMGKLADIIVEIKAPSKVKAVEGFTSAQPMTTLNEQCLLVFFDAVVLALMEHLEESHDTMWERHSQLE